MSDAGPPRSGPPIVFLDLDGVVHTMRHQASVRDEHDTFDPHAPDPVAVGLLRRLSLETGCSYVVTSTRRKIHRWEEIFSPLISAGLPLSSIHRDWRTPVLGAGYRGLEVRDWLERHPETPAYVCVDDDRDYLPDQPLVVCDVYDGMGFRQYLLSKALLLGEEIPSICTGAHAQAKELVDMSEIVAGIESNRNETA